MKVESETQLKSSSELTKIVLKHKQQIPTWLSDEERLLEL